MNKALFYLFIGMSYGLNFLAHCGGRFGRKMISLSVKAEVKACDLKVGK